MDMSADLTALLSEPFVAVVVIIALCIYGAFRL